MTAEIFGGLTLLCGILLVYFIVTEEYREDHFDYDAYRAKVRKLIRSKHPVNFTYSDAPHYGHMTSAFMDYNIKRIFFEEQNKWMTIWYSYPEKTRQRLLLLQRRNGL